MNTLKKTAYRPSLQNLFDDVFGRDAFEHQPLTNILESEAAFEIELLAPGRHKADFQIDLNEQILHVSAKHPESKSQENEKSLRREFSLGTWKRAFNLGKESIDLEHIEAQYQDGILKIRLPKLSANKQSLQRKIDLL